MPKNNLMYEKDVTLSFDSNTSVELDRRHNKTDVIIKYPADDLTDETREKIKSLVDSLDLSDMLKEVLYNSIFDKILEAQDTNFILEHTK